MDTERLILSPLTPEDHQFIIALVNSKGWLEFIGDRKVHSKNDAITYIDKIINTQDIFYRVVRLKSDNIPIGIISFLKRSYLENFDIGFAFLPEFIGYGYAHEATQKVMEEIAQSKIHSHILATTIPNNINSIKLLKKLGFQFDKEIETDNEKLHVYSIEL